MRILYAIHSWHPEGIGGTELHALAAGSALERQGHSLGVFARTLRPDRPEYEVTTEWQGKTSITRINNTFKELPNFEWVYRNRRIHAAFERDLAEFKPDLVHIHHLTGLSSTIIETMKAQGIPVVMTLHDFWMFCPRGQRMTKELKLCETIDRKACFTCMGAIWPHFFNDKTLDRLVVDLRGGLSPAVLAEWDRHTTYILNLCDLLICPSAFHRERILDFPLDPERVVALPHGLDTTPFERGKRGHGTPKRIGFIGAVVPVKGAHVLIEAFRRLNRPELSLDIFGEFHQFHNDQNYQESLKSLVRGLPNVRFHGHYDAREIGKILEQIDILVVPSLWWETFCITLREGLLAGIPVLASDLGALREALDGERDGVLFKVGDAEDLKNKLARMIDDPAYRERFYNRQASVKSIDAYAGELVSVYEQAIDVARKRAGKLVVAPPSFPSSQLPGAVAVPALPWDRIDIATKQRGAARIGVETRLPTQEWPVLGVKLDLRDGAREMGTLDVEINMQAMADVVAAAAGNAVAPPVPAPEVPAAPASQSPAVPKDAPARVPGRASAGQKSDKSVVKRTVVKRKSAVARKEVISGKVKTSTWRPENLGEKPKSHQRKP